MKSQKKGAKVFIPKTHPKGKTGTKKRIVVKVKKDKK